jgi:hypothetical protein
MAADARRLFAFASHRGFITDLLDRTCHAGMADFASVERRAQATTPVSSHMPAGGKSKCSVLSCTEIKQTRYPLFGRPTMRDASGN